MASLWGLSFLKSTRRPARVILLVLEFLEFPSLWAWWPNDCVINHRMTGATTMAYRCALRTNSTSYHCTSQWCNCGGHLIATLNSAKASHVSYDIVCIGDSHGGKQNASYVCDYQSTNMKLAAYKPKITVR